MFLDIATSVQSLRQPFISLRLFQDRMLELVDSVDYIQKLSKMNHCIFLGVCSYPSMCNGDTNHHVRWSHLKVKFVCPNCSLAGVYMATYIIYLIKSTPSLSSPLLFSFSCCYIHIPLCSGEPSHRSLYTIVHPLALLTWIWNGKQGMFS